MADICSQYGNSAPASYAYACCSLICEITGEIELGYQFGQLSLKVLEQFKAKEFASKVIMVYNACVRHWKEHGRSTLNSLLEAVKSGLETGDIEYACYAAMYLCIYSFFIGEDLNAVEQKYEQYVALMLSLKQEYQIYYTKIWRQLVLNLQGLSPEKYRLMGDSFNEDELLPVLIEANNVSSIFGVYFAKLVINYLLNNDTQAVENAQLAENYAAGVGSLMMIPQHNFYYSLALLSRYSNAKPSEQEEYLRQVEINQEKMKTWAYHAPMNYQHKYELVAAEKARVLGQRLEAMDYYDQAIVGAKEHEYIQEEALANELAAKFYLVLGKLTIAKTYLTNAYYAYARWGAKAKIEDLEQRYAQLLTPILKQEKILHPSETIVQKSHGTITSTSGGISEVLDLATVIKACQALSGEVHLDLLLSRLMQVTLENAGASKGVLILVEQGTLVIEAVTLASHLADQVTPTSDNQNPKTTFLRLPSIPITSSDEVPVTVLNYVSRTSQPLVLRDATDEITFAADPYITEHQLKSVLCTPIINQGQLIGLLYLENNLTVGAFPPDRLEVLEILSTQAAISIENARFYQTLENKVNERTAQLAQATKEIKTLNEKLRAENLRLSAELEITKQLQQMILPKQEELELIEGLDIAGFMEPAEEVGGDYYDVIQQNGQVKISIGDVTGHGLESGVVMLMAQTAVRTLQESKQTDPVKFLDILNRTLYRNVQRINPYKNLTLSVLDYANGILKVSGQHESLIVVRTEGQVEQIDTMHLGFPLGLEEDIAAFIASEQVQLYPGDVVVLYTDGITEAFDINCQQYGIKQLCEVVSRYREYSAQEIREAVISDVRRHIGEQKIFDDITLLVLKQK
jgi:serine phosphatase RsbU (regulator of sigma subunit)